jgi:hypothetical protein
MRARNQQCLEGPNRPERDEHDGVRVGEDDAHGSFEFARQKRAQQTRSMRSEVCRSCGLLFGRFVGDAGIGPDLRVRVRLLAPIAAPRFSNTITELMSGRAPSSIYCSAHVSITRRISATVPPFALINRMSLKTKWG